MWLWSVCLKLAYTMVSPPGKERSLLVCSLASLGDSCSDLQMQIFWWPSSGVLVEARHSFHSDATGPSPILPPWSSRPFCYFCYCTPCRLFNAVCILFCVVLDEVWSEGVKELALYARCLVAWRHSWWQLVGFWHYKVDTATSGPSIQRAGYCKEKEVACWWTVSERAQRLVVS